MREEESTHGARGTGRGERQRKCARKELAGSTAACVWGQPGGRGHMGPGSLIPGRGEPVFTLRARRSQGRATGDLSLEKIPLVVDTGSGLILSCFIKPQALGTEGTVKPPPPLSPHSQGSPPNSNGNGNIVQATVSFPSFPPQPPPHPTPLAFLVPPSLLHDTENLSSENSRPGERQTLSPGSANLGVLFSVRVSRHSFH